MAKQSQIVAGLDLGTSKVAVVIAEISEHKKDIIGVSMVPGETTLIRLFGAISRATARAKASTAPPTLESDT